MTALVRALILVAAWCAPASTMLPPAGLPRLCAVSVSLLLFPGLPLALRLTGRDVAPRSHCPGVRRLERAVLTGAVSLAGAILVSQILVLAGAFSARLVLVVIAALTTVAVLAPTRRRDGGGGAVAAG